MKTIKKVATNAFRDITMLGSAIGYTIITLVVFLLGQKQIALTLVAGFLASLLIVTLIRMLYFKERPKKQSHTNLIEKIDASSFPSWHATRAVFVALVLGMQASRAAQVALTIIALLVIYSRFHLKKHDWYDLSAGSILGFLLWLLANHLL